MKRMNAFIDLLDRMIANGIKRITIRWYTVHAAYQWNVLEKLENAGYALTTDENGVRTYEKKEEEKQ